MIEDEFIENKREQLLCFCCDKIISYDGTFDSATVWSSSGNYGSSLLDLGFRPNDPSYLELYICDDCLDKRSDNVCSVYTLRERTKYRYENGYDAVNSKYKKKK